eukprot:scaffold19.g1847.t1
MTVAHKIAPEWLPPEAKGLVFDLDGTLLDTMSYHWHAWDRVAKAYGLELSVERLLSLAGKPSRAIMELLCEEQGRQVSAQGTPVDIAEAVAAKTAFYVELAAETQPVQCVMEIAQAAKARGLPIAVATGGNKKQARWSRDVHVYKSMVAAGLMEVGPDGELVSTFFDAVVTSDCIAPGNGKPHPETFLRAAELIGVAPADCVGYEDAPLGMEAIRRAGFLKAILVTEIPGYPKLAV